MELTKVDIGDFRYFHKFELEDKTLVTEVTTKETYDNLSATTPTKIDSTYKMSSIRIGFDTPTGELGDGQYATQENGSHWVKLKGYTMIKILPEYIKDDILSNEGIVKVKRTGNEE